MPDQTKHLWRMDDAEAIIWLRNNLTAAQSQKADAISRCIRYRDMYLALDTFDMRMDEADDPIEQDARAWSNTYLPVVAARVDTSVCNIFNTFFANPDYLEFDVDEEADEAFAFMFAAHQMRLHREMNFKQRVFQALLACHCYDYAITLVSWRLDGGFVPKREIMIDNVNLGGYSLPKRRIDFGMRWVPDKVDRPEVYNIDYFKCWHDWRAKNGFDDSSFFFDEIEIDLADLKENEKSDDNPGGKYYNLEIIEKKIKESGAAKTPEKANDPAIKDDNLDARWRVTINRGFTRHETVWFVDDTIIRRQRTFDWPLQQWRFYQRPGEFPGMGLVQRAERMQYDINTDINQRRNYYNLVLDPPVVRHTDLDGLNDDKVTGLPPGREFSYSGDRDVRELLYVYQPQAPPPPNAMTELGLEIKTLDEVMGTNQNITGSFAPGRRSAREVGFVNSGSMQRFLATAKLLESNCLEPIYQHTFLLNQLYMTRAVRFKHYGEKGVYSMRVTPEDYKMNGGGSFMAKGVATVSDKAVHIQQFLTAMDRALMAPQYNNLPAIFTEMWKLLVPHKYQRFALDPTAGRENIPQSLEIEIMAQGRTAQVSPANNHQEHLAEIQAYMQAPDYQLWPNAYKRNLEVHAQTHQAMMMQSAGIAAGARARSNSLSEEPTGEAGVSQGMRDTSIGVTP